MRPAARIRALAQRLARGAREVDPLYNEALELLDECGDDMDPAARDFLDEVRFGFHELTSIRSPAARRRREAELAALASDFLARPGSR